MLVGGGGGEVTSQSLAVRVGGMVVVVVGDLSHGWPLDYERGGGGGRMTSAVAMLGGVPWHCWENLSCGNGGYKALRSQVESRLSLSLILDFYHS